LQSDTTEVPSTLVQHYAVHLNDTELDLIAGLVPPGQMLIRRAQSSKKVRLNVDSVSHWMATNMHHVSPEIA
jgi:type IV secretion system protein VirB4